MAIWMEDSLICENHTDRGCVSFAQVRGSIIRGRNLQLLYNYPETRLAGSALYTAKPNCRLGSASTR